MNLLRIALITLFLISLNANASINIKYVELADTSIIDGTQVSAITLNDMDSSVDSVETTDGSIFHSSEIKKVILSKPFGTKFNNQAMSKIGGEGSGG